MLIDTKQIVTKTELRRNLTEILSEVVKGKEVIISERGNVKAKLLPLGESEEKNSGKFFKEIKFLRASLAEKNSQFDSLQALKEMRKEN